MHSSPEKRERGREREADARRLLEVLARVGVVHVVARDVELELGAKVLEVLVERQVAAHLDAARQARLERPRARDVANRVAAAADDDHGHVEGAHEGDALGVARHAQVERAELVARERVGAALEDDGARAVPVHDVLQDGAEHAAVAVVVDAVLERVVDGVALAAPLALVALGARAGEEVAELVERGRHDAVGRVEGLLDAVAVVDVDVDVQDARVVPQELEDGEDDVVDVAEARRLALLGVVEAAGPVDGDVGLGVDQTAGGAEGAASRDGAELEQALEGRAVLADEEALAVAGDVVEGFWRDAGEAVDVLVGVEARHLVGRAPVGALQGGTGPGSALERDEGEGRERERGDARGRPCACRGRSW